jgi:flagellar basal-body rod protein FlgB
MDIKSIPLFEAITRRLAWLSDRQTVLAENVANANTPGYLSKDIKEPDFHALVTGGSSVLQIAATQPGHITTRPDGEVAGSTPDANEVTLDGNGVSIEAQMMKVSDNAADYALTTTLYKQNLALIKMALGGS